MKNFLILIPFLLLIISCGKDKKEAKVVANETSTQNIPAFSPEVIDLSVKDLPLKSKDDTISYALGIAWGNQIASKLGLSKVSYAFYQGAHDYMVQNKTFTNMTEASERLEKEIEFLKTDVEHDFDINQKLSDIELSSKYDTLSYQLAYAWMRGAKDYGISRITPTLLLGLTNGMQSDTTLFDYSKADKYLRAYIEQQREQKFLSVKIANEEWLAQNKTKKDIVTLPSGLQYKIIKNGTGKSPKADEIIICHYTGKLTDNSKFESSYDTGEPLKAYPSGVIVAWREALPKMKVGSIWELYVPYNLGYGSGGIKGKVPPFSTLIYEIELLGIEPGVK
jgi:FKBP-type peptidyl-prolyl cis-trans isomerase FklB